MQTLRALQLSSKFRIWQCFVLWIVVRIIVGLIVPIKLILELNLCFLGKRGPGFPLGKPWFRNLYFRPHKLITFWTGWTLSTWFPHRHVGSPKNCYVYVFMLIWVSKLKKKLLLIHILFNMYMYLFLLRFLKTLILPKLTYWVNHQSFRWFCNLL